MARFTADGRRSATTLFEAAAWHESIQVTCGRCSRTETFNARGLWWLFHRRGWAQSLRRVGEHLHCKVCRERYGHRVRQPRIALVADAIGDRYLTLPPDSEWERAVSRFRN